NEDNPCGRRALAEDGLRTRFRQPAARAPFHLICIDGLKDLEAIGTKSRIIGFGRASRYWVDVSGGCDWQIPFAEGRVRLERGRKCATNFVEHSHANGGYPRDGPGQGGNASRGSTARCSTIGTDRPARDQVISDTFELWRQRIAALPAGTIDK